MASRLNAPPEAALVTARPTAANTALPRAKPLDPQSEQREQQRARQSEIDELLNQALSAPPQPPKDEPALATVDRTIAPLADTLSAIESAQQVVVENLRNAETSGFKATRTAVGDRNAVLYQLDDTQGAVEATHRTLDVAIQGPGFFQIKVYTADLPDGGVGVTRNGRLYMSRDGTLAVGQVEGYQLIPPIHLPTGVTQVTIGQDGTVSAVSSGDASSLVVGKIPLVRFVDPSSLHSVGGGIYMETEASGTAVETPAGSASAGAIVQGHLEASNVDLVRERLRLRFLQGWRANLTSAMASPTPAAASPSSTPRPSALPATVR